jgi:hypothetical protein
MSETKFKVGDKIRIVNPIVGYPYSTGDQGVVTAAYSETLYTAEFGFPHGVQNVAPCEMELVDKDVVYVDVPPAPKLVEAFRQEAKRYNEGKAPLSYLLYWPKAIEAIANVCRKGEEKYEKFNYKKGAPVSQYMDSGLRHQTAFVNGEDLDKETNCYHLAMDIWNKMQALEVMLTPEMKERFDDRYKGGTA